VDRIARDAAQPLTGFVDGVKVAIPHTERTRPLSTLLSLTGSSFRSLSRSWTHVERAFRKSRAPNASSFGRNSMNREAGVSRKIRRNLVETESCSTARRRFCRKSIETRPRRSAMRLDARECDALTGWLRPEAAVHYPTMYTSRVHAVSVYMAPTRGACSLATTASHCRGPTVVRTW
jgi:hypothetical protein